MAEKLITNKSTNTSGDVEADTFQCQGNALPVAAWATTWSGAKVTLKARIKGGDSPWLPITDNSTPVSFISNEIKYIDRLTGDFELGASISDATGTTVDVNVAVGK